MDSLSENTPPRAGAHSWTATGHERPVFLDERGRRRRWVLAGGALAGGLATLWLAALIAGAIGFATLPAWRLAGHLHHRDRARPEYVLRLADRDAAPLRRREATARVPGGARSASAVLSRRQPQFAPRAS